MWLPGTLEVSIVREGLTAITNSPRYFCHISYLMSLQMDKSQSPLSKSGTPSPSHREALTPGAPGAPGAPGPSTSCLRLVSKAPTSADPLGETVYTS